MLLYFEFFFWDMPVNFLESSCFAFHYTLRNHFRPPYIARDYSIVLLTPLTFVFPMTAAAQFGKSKIFIAIIVLLLQLRRCQNITSALCSKIQYLILEVITS